VATPNAATILMPVYFSAPPAAFVSLLAVCDSLRGVLLRHFGIKGLQSKNLSSPCPGICEGHCDLFPVRYIKSSIPGFHLVLFPFLFAPGR
jgi:hypothetical protein